MQARRCPSIAYFRAVLSTASPAHASVHEVPLIRLEEGFQQGFVRVEAFDAGGEGEPRIEAWDDSGHHAETALTIQAGSIRDFNSSDLEFGNALRDSPTGIDMPMIGTDARRGALSRVSNLIGPLPAAI